MYLEASSYYVQLQFLQRHSNEIPALSENPAEGSLFVGHRVTRAKTPRPEPIPGPGQRDKDQESVNMGRRCFYNPEISRLDLQLALKRLGSIKKPSETRTCVPDSLELPIGECPPFLEY